MYDEMFKLKIERKQILYRIESFIVIAIILGTILFMLEKNIYAYLSIIFMILSVCVQIRNLLNTNKKIKGLKSNSIYIDSDYNRRIKILGSYNKIYKYQSYAFIYAIIIILILMIIFGKVEWFSIFGVTNKNNMVQLLGVFFLLAIGIFAWIFCRNHFNMLESKLNNKYDITYCYDATMPIVKGSKLYSYLDNLKYYKYDNEKMHYFYDDSNRIRFAYNTTTMDLKKCKIAHIQIYEANVSLEGEIVYKVMDDALVAIYNKNISGELLVLSNELKAKDTLYNSYTIKTNGYTLTDENKKELDRLWKKDVFELSIVNGILYIKKYIRLDKTDKKEIDAYLDLLDEFDKFVDKL